MVTNNMSCIPKSDRIYVMSHGKIAQSGNFSEIKDLDLWARYCQIMGAGFLSSNEDGADPIDQI